MHIKIEHISKSFDGKLHIADVSFEARPGFISCLLGQKGAGKSTVLQMLLGILKPDEGYIAFDDKPLNSKILDKIGYLPEERGLYQEFTLNEILVYFARLKHIPRKKAQVEAVRLMDRFNLIDQMETPVCELSEEIQFRVLLLLSIIHNPDVIIFDEPFRVRDDNLVLIRKLITRLREEGKTIILSTEQISEAELLADEITILHRGELILKGQKSALLERFKENIIIVEAEDNLQPLKNIPGVKRIVQEKQVARLYVDKQMLPQKVLEAIIRTVNVSRVEVHKPGLNEIYLEAVEQFERANV
ncbi:MAG: ATP-binding cassette domain-containing protein [Calditrichaeota bacterium]|nr:MAG: ATP-binding cassette domain-containing protein [Calditrichota bacterium]